MYDEPLVSVDWDDLCGPPVEPFGETAPTPTPPPPALSSEPLPLSQPAPTNSTETSGLSVDSTAPSSQFSLEIADSTSSPSTIGSFPPNLYGESPEQDGTKMENQEMDEMDDDEDDGANDEEDVEEEDGGDGDDEDEDMDDNDGQYSAREESPPPKG